MGKIIRLTESELVKLVKKVLQEQKIDKTKPYYFFTTSDKTNSFKPGPSKFVNIIPKDYYMQVIFNPKPNGGVILYDCSGQLKIGLPGSAGYRTTKTITYNDTLVTALNKTKYCKTGTYVNPNVNVKFGGQDNIDADIA
jgi:hypothetical protein